MMREIWQLLLPLTLGIVIAVLSIKLSRMGRLSFAYTIGWLLVSVFIAAAGAALVTIGFNRKFIGIPVGSLLLAILSLLFVAVMIQLSISISGLQRRVSVLNESIAQNAMDREKNGA